MTGDAYELGDNLYVICKKYILCFPNWLRADLPSHKSVTFSSEAELIQARAWRHYRTDEIYKKYLMSQK